MPDMRILALEFPEEEITGGEKQAKIALEVLSEKFQLFPIKLGKKLNILCATIVYLRKIWIYRPSNRDILFFDYSKRQELLIVIFFSRIIWGCKTICLAQAFYFAYRKSRVKNFLDKAVSILFFRMCDLVITSGRAASRIAIDLGVKQEWCAEVYPAIRTELLAIDQSIKKVEVLQERPKILFVGRVDPIKGIDYLVEAFANINIKNSELLIVGNTLRCPEYVQSIKDKANKLNVSSRIQWIGNVSDPVKLAEYYMSSHVLVLPSLWDTSPITLAEALLFGLPVVATNVGGIPEYVIDGENGLLVPPRDPDKLKIAIERVLNDDSMRQNLIEGSRKSLAKMVARTWEDAKNEYATIVSNFVGQIE